MTFSLWKTEFLFGNMMVILWKAQKLEKLEGLEAWKAWDVQSLSSEHENQPGGLKLGPACGNNSCDGRRIWICVFVFIIVHARLDPFRAEQEQIHFFAVFLSFGKYHVMWWIMWLNIDGISTRPLGSPPSFFSMDGWANYKNRTYRGNPPWQSQTTEMRAPYCIWIEYLGAPTF